MTDVFVSYKAEDRGRVAPLVRALEKDGVSVWWDAHIGAGDDWRETILRHLEGSRAVIVVWSRRSVGPRGQFVRDEASRAVKRKTYLPILIDKVDPPLGFGETQAHDLTGWKGDPLDPRYESIRSALGTRFQVKATSLNDDFGTKARVSRRGIIASVAAVAVAGGGAGAWLWSGKASVEEGSIAVLPFENLSGDSSENYFSDGIAEELRSALARIPGLRVVARTSSEAVRNADAVTAAAKLRVTDILTGSVRRSPQMLRISAQLVDGKDGTARWSEVYDRPVGDALKIQSEIADKVAIALKFRIGPIDKDLRASGGTDNPRAQDLYLRAEAAIRQDDREPGIRAALGLIEAALIEDPRYGNAMTSKANRLSQLGSTFAANNRAGQLLLRQAEEAAKQAVAMAPLSSAAHVALGSIYYWSFQFPAALKEFEKVQSLGDRSGSDLAIIAWMVAMLRQFDVGLRLADEAVALDPLNSDVHNHRADVLLNAGRLPEAEQAVRRAIQLNANQWYPHLLYATILLNAGRLTEAQREAAKVDRGSMSTIATQSIIAERLGNRNESNRLLDEILNSEKLSGSHYQVAQIYAQQKRSNDALAELDKAFVARDPGLAQMQTDFTLDPIRRERHFQDLVKRLGFPT